MKSLRSHIFWVTFVAFAALGSAGCATVSTSARLHFGLSDTADSKQLMWPPEPEIPRFQFAGELTGEDNFVRENDMSGVKSFLAWVVGLFEADAPNVMQRPQTVISDENGRIYVSDISRAAVLVFDEGAGELKVWRNAVGFRGFVAPIGIALAREGGIWVADAELGVIAHLDKDGNALEPIGMGILQRPTGLARDSKTGHLYVADTHAHDIKVFSEDGALLHTMGKRGNNPGDFNYPTHLFIARDKLYVTDTMNNRVQIFPLSGGDPQIIGQRGLYVGNLVRPKGVAADSENNIYIIESYYDSLLVFNEDGDFLMPIGGTGQSTGQFYLPSGVWVDSFDRVFVADTFNGRIMLFKYLGGARADGY